MSNAVTTPMDDFQKQLMERVRGDIGELLPDKVLADVVAKGFQTAFFEERITKDRYGHAETRRPPVVVEVVAEICEKQAREAMVEWLDKNPHVLKEVMALQVKKGLAAAMMNNLSAAINGELANLRGQVRDNLDKAGIPNDLW